MTWRKRWPSPKLTPEVIEAASNVLGWDVEADWLLDALRQAFDYSDAQIKRNLKELEEKFKASGGRGVDLAEEIDKARAVLAARKVK